MSLTKIVQVIRRLPFFKKTPSPEFPIPLCPEILSMIWELLDLKSLCNLSQTCKSLDMKRRVKIFKSKKINQALINKLNKDLPELLFLRFKYCNLSGKDLNFEEFLKLRSVQLIDTSIAKCHAVIKLSSKLRNFILIENSPSLCDNKLVEIDGRSCKSLDYFEVVRSTSYNGFIFYPPQVSCLKIFKCPDSEGSIAYDKNDTLGESNWAENIEELELNISAGFSSLLSYRGGRLLFESGAKTFKVPLNVRKATIFGLGCTSKKFQIMTEGKQTIQLELSPCDRS